MLPGPVRDELRRTVEGILQPDSSYKGPYVIGRPDEKAWKRVREGVRRLAVMCKSLLETQPTKGA
jgi:hypothetical protein